MKYFISSLLTILCFNVIYASYNDCDWQKKLNDCSHYILNYNTWRCYENNECEGHPINSLIRAYILWMQLLEERYIGEPQKYFSKLFELEQLVDANLANLKNADNSKEELDLFLYGAFLNFKARIFFLESKRISSLRTANKCNEIFKKLLKKNPAFYDAYFYLGLYNYIVDSLPTLAKIVRIIVLVPSGDKKKGLEQIKLAAFKGKYIQGEALLLLAAIYQYDQKKYDAANKIVSILNKAYPHNPWFELWAIFYKDYFENKPEEAEMRLIELSNKIPTSLKGTNFKNLLDFYIAENYIRQLKYNNAINKLSNLTKVYDEMPNWLKVLTNFYLAYANEEIGDYKNSRINYKKILSMPSSSDYHKYSKKALTYLGDNNQDNERYDLFRLHILIQRNDLSKAGNVIKKLMKTSIAKDELFNYYYACFYLKKGDANKSLSLLKKIENRHFKYYWLEGLVYIRIGDIYYELNRYKDALEYYDKAKKGDIIFSWEKWHLEYRISKVRGTE